MNVIRSGWEEFFRDVVEEATDDEKRWLEATFYGGAITVLSAFFELEKADGDIPTKAAQVGDMLMSMREEIRTFRDEHRGGAVNGIEITELGRALDQSKEPGGLVRLADDGTELPLSSEAAERELALLRQALQEGRVVLSGSAKEDLARHGLSVDQLFSALFGNKKH